MFLLSKHFVAVNKMVGWLVGWLCLTSHRQGGHLETAPPFTVPCEGHEALLYTVSTGNRNPGSLCDSPLHNKIESY